jgi:hypothetical protein
MPKQCTVGDKEAACYFLIARYLLGLEYPLAHKIDIK